MDWFRLYAEFASDPKVQMMDEAMQRRLVMLFCLQCCNGLETFHETERETSIAFALRISEQQLAETKDLFLRKEFIESDWTLCNWNKRQYISDSSTARVRKHREAKKQADETLETLQQRSSNAPEQNRTEQITTLSGEPDAAPDTLQAQQAIDHLNEKAGANYRHVDSNIRLVKARLSEGYSLEEVKAVIDAQVGKWASNPAMEQYLRPKTLFNATNFSNYAGTTAAPISGWWLSAGFESAFDAENHGCTRSNADQWYDRKRIEVIA